VYSDFHTSTVCAFLLVANILCLLLRSSLGLGSLLLVAADHNDTEEGSDNRGTEKNEDDRDADGPNAGREEALQRVAFIDKGL
jgi:hypothetical protein